MPEDKYLERLRLKRSQGMNEPVFKEEGSDDFSLQSEAIQGVGNVYDRDADVDTGFEKVSDLDRLNTMRAQHQSFGQELWRGIKNIPDNTFLGIRQQINGIKGLFPNVDEDWKWLLPAFAVPDEILKAISNARYGVDENKGGMYDTINALGEEKNRHGEIYKKNPDKVWDASDSAFWTSNGTNLVQSIGEFFVTGFGAGSLIKAGIGGLTKGVLKKGLQKMAQKGASDYAIGTTKKMVEQGLPQLLTAGTMAYTEGVLSGASVYKQTYDTLLASTGDEEFAREAASGAAAKTVGINTAINTVLNIYGLGPIFKNLDNVKFNFSALKRAAGEGTPEYLGRLNKLSSSYTGSVGKTVGKIVPEMGFEALEEGVNVFAEKAGLGEVDQSLNGLVKSLMSDEGTLSMFLGALGGVGQMIGLDNVPKFQSDPTNNITRWDSARSTEVKLKSKQYGAVLKNIKDDLREVSEIETEIEEAVKNNDNKKVDILRERLFNIPAARYILNENTDVLVNTLNEIKKTDNSQANQEGKTKAQLEGLSISETDNDYKKKVDKQIAKIEQYEKHYKENIKAQYGHLEEQLPGLTRELLDLHINRSSISDNLIQAEQDLQKKKLDLIQTKSILGIIDYDDSTEAVTKRKEYKAVKEQEKFIEDLRKDYLKVEEKEDKLLSDPVKNFKPEVDKGTKEFNKIVDSVKPTDEDTSNKKEDRKETLAVTKQVTNTTKEEKKPVKKDKLPEPPAGTEPTDLTAMLAKKQAELENKDTSVTNNDIIDNIEDSIEKDVALSENTTQPVERPEFTGQNNDEDSITEVIEEQEDVTHDKLTNPVFSMAYGSMRQYIEDGNVIMSFDNEYNQEVDTYILDPKFNKGSKITFKALTEEDFVPFITQKDITFIDGNGNTIVVARKGVEVTFDILEAAGESMLPIGIYNEDGKKIGHVHDMSYMREDRVAEVVNLDQARYDLTELRKAILDGSVSSAIIDSKSRGKVTKNAITTEGSQIESLNGTKLRLTNEAVLGDVEFFVAQNKDNLLDKAETVISINGLKNDFKAQAGRSYVKLPTSNGEDFYLPLQHLKLSDFPEYVNELLETVDSFYNKQITYAQLQETFGKYLYSYPTELKGEDDKFVYINDKKDSYLVTDNDRFYIDFDRSNGVTFGKSGGRITFITQNTPDADFSKYKDKLESLLNNSYIHIKPTSDPEFIKTHTASNIVSIKLPDGSYSYFENPVVTFITSDQKMSVETPIESTEVIKEEGVVRGTHTDPNTGSNLEISDETIDENPDFDKQVDLIAIIDPRITSVQQIETVNFFTGYTIGKLKEGLTIPEAFKSLKDLFDLYKDKPNAKMVIDNFERFLDLTSNNLSKMDVSEDTWDENEAENNANWDSERSLKVNPNEKATAEVKKLFSSIVDIKNDGTERRNWLGLSYYLTMDEVMNNLAGQLVDIDPSNGYKDMIVKLTELSKDTPYIKSVISLLEKSDNQVKNQFTQWATKHTVTKKFIQWSSNDDRTDTSARIIESNRNSLINSITDAWYDNFNTATFIVEDAEGNYIADTKFVGKDGSLIKDFDNMLADLEKDKDVTADLVKWLNTIGINVDERTIKEFITQANGGKIKVGKGKGNRLTFLQHFNSKAGIFSLINERLKGKDAGEFEDQIDKYNPTRENSGIRLFANFVSKYFKAAFSNSFRDINNNTIYSYSVNKFTFTQLNKVFNSDYLKGLRNFPFQVRSWYIDNLLNDSSFQEEFDIFYIDGIKKRMGSKGKSIDKMSPNEQEKFRWMLFQNQGRLTEVEGKVRRWIQSTFLTTSDKSTLLGINTEGIISKYDWDNNRVSDESLKPLLDLVLSEYDRIIYTNNEKAAGKEFTSNDYKDGSALFLLFPHLNNGYDSKYEFVYKTIYDDAGNLKPFDTTGDIQNTLNQFLNEYVISLTDDKLDTWIDTGVLQGVKGDINKITFLDRSYKKNIANKQILENEKGNKQIYNNQLAFYSALDYVLNTQIMNGNLYQLFAGDPANYYETKYNDGDIKSKVARTYINIGKRLAGLIAPGNSLVNTKGKDIAGIDGFQYLQLFANDLSYKSARLDYLKKILSPDELGKYEKGIKTTDAQEYTTLQEHLYVMYHDGKLSDKQYKSLLEKAKTGKDFNESELNVILQPIKPVYFDLRANGNNKVLEPVYIKTSSFPLIPQLTKDQEIDKLRTWMEDVEKKSTKNVRLTFESGNKLGKVSQYLNIFNSDNTVNTDNLDYKKSSRLLDRDGFRIQQEVPYKEGDKVTTGSQETKLIWTNLLKTTGFKFKGKTLVGKALKDIYDAKYKRLYEIRTKKFNETFLNADGSLNYAKLKDELVTEAIKRSWSPNDIAALDVISKDGSNKFVFPLYLNNSSDRIESLLIAIVDNKIRKNKSKGYSYVLGSPAGFKTLDQLTSNEKSGIITIEGYEGKELKGMHIDDKGNIRGAQVYVPFKHKDNKGNMLNVRDFTKEIDGRLYLDTTKMDSDLLKSFGFRIPTQVHSSMSYIEIVGFLPESMGDLIIAPADFIEQMGSDFDIDKLYGYLYNTTYNITSKKLSRFDRETHRVNSYEIYKDVFTKKVKENWDEILFEEELDKAKILILFKNNPEFKEKLESVLYVDITVEDALDILIDKGKMKSLEDFTIDEESVEVKEIEDDILDIHFSVMTNPDKSLQRQIAHPLGMGKLGEWKLDAINKWKRFNLDKYNVLSDEYQKIKYQNARGAKDLVGIFSVVNTFNTVLQNAPDIKYGFTDIISKDFIELKLRVQGFGTKALSATKTLSGRFKSEIFAAFQSAAVDNEKEAVLEYLNINPETSSAITAMIQSGYDEDIIIPLINQPIILDFVKSLLNSKDTTTDTRQQSKATIYNNLLKDIYKSENLSQEQISELEKSVQKDGIDLNALNRNLTSPLRLDQAKALVFFNNASIMGSALQKLASSLNTDSSGLPKTFIGTDIKQENYLGVLTNKKFINAEPLVGLIEEGTLTPKGINSVASYYSLNRVNEIFGQLFKPYKSWGFKHVKDTIAKEKMFEEDESTLEAREEREKEIWNNVKSFVYANAISEQFGESIGSMRERLLKGDNSLAKRIKKLKKELKKNSFINRLDTQVAKKKEDYDKILFKAAVGSNLNELDLYTDFLGLEESLRNDLIMYFYITGGIQEANQFGKYISNKYLHFIGFSEILGKVDFDNTSAFEGVVEEYFQNNPEDAIRVVDEHVTWAKDKKSFTIKKEFIGSYINGKDADGSTFVNYLSENNYTKSDAKNFRLFKLSYVSKQGLVFDVHNTKGGSYLKEYGGGNFSILKGNNHINIDNKKEDNKSSIFDRKDNVVSGIKTENKANNNRLLDRYKISPKNNSKEVLSILDAVISNSPKDGNKALAKTLKVALKGIKDYSIVLGDKNQQLNGVVTLRQSINNVKELEDNLLHELLHVVTSHLVKAYFGENNVKLTDNQLKAVKGLENLVNGIRLKIKNGQIEDYTWEELQRFEELYTIYKKDKDLVTDENEFLKLRDKYYGLIKAVKKTGHEPRLLIEEFITLAGTQTELQNMLNNTAYTESRTAFQKLLDLIVNLFRDFVDTFKVGDQEINPDNYLFETLQDIFVLTFEQQQLDESNTTEETTEEDKDMDDNPDLGITVANLLRSLPREEMLALRKLMSEKKIIFKCK